MTLRIYGLLSALLATGVSIGVSQSAMANDQEAIPPWTLALEHRLQPWCPAGCVTEVPFVAVYKKAGISLVFVGVHHEFTAQNRTTRAVDAGFSAISPGIVIVEGFPTAMGENPPPLVKQAQMRGTPQASDFTRGEAMYAVSLALGRGVPFIGGEPTRQEQVLVLEQRGYSPADIGFAYLVGGLSQSLRSGDISSTGDPKLAESFATWAQAFADQYNLKPLSFDEFSKRYLSTFGVAITKDTKLAERSEPGTSSPVSLLNQTDMVTRDEHLITLIEKQLEEKKEVLVVYGGSHWTTLSKALQKRLGTPTIQPFVD